MTETSLGKLQNKVTKLEQKLVQYQDKAEKFQYEAKLWKLKYQQLEKNVEQVIEQAVKKATEQVKEEYEKEIKKLNQRIFELETRLNINSENSSLPSSKNPVYQSKICNSRKPSEKNKGGQIGHKKSQLEKFKKEEITEIAPHVKISCPKCYSMELKETGRKERDELDYDIQIIKRRHQFYEYECQKCGNIVKSEIPKHLQAENNYGSNIKTLALTLINYGNVSYNRTRKIIRGITKETINPSEGYLTKLQKEASEKLKDFLFDVEERIKGSKLVYWDDTVIKIGEKEKSCLRVYTNNEMVRYKAHYKKDALGMEEDGILQNLSSESTVMHDHVTHNYCEAYRYQNIECNAHITRKLEGITQNTEHKWSEEMKELLERTLEKRNALKSSKKEKFPNDFMKEFDQQYDSILEKGFQEYILFQHKYEFSKEENLLEFMRDYKEAITKWVRDFTLPYSNNVSESLLRMLKSKMKISYQFTNLNYAQYFADILSYTESCGKCGVSKVESLRRLFENNPYSVQELLEIKKEIITKKF